MIKREFKLNMAGGSVMYAEVVGPIRPRALVFCSRVFIWEEGEYHEVASQRLDYLCRTSLKEPADQDYGQQEIGDGCPTHGESLMVDP